MTLEGRQAILRHLAHALEQQREGVKLAALAHGRMAEATLWRVLHGADHRVTTLIEVADALDCDVIIQIRKR